MHFKYVIFSVSALLIQVSNGQNDGSSFGCFCDTSISSPVPFSYTKELGSLSGNNVDSSDSITSCGDSNQSEKSNSTAAAFTLIGEKESSCDRAADRYRRASHPNGVGSDGLRCSTNLLKARLALATATARAAASNEQQDAFVAAKFVPVPAELTPPRLLHKQSINGLSLSPCPIDVPTPSCNCFSFGPSSVSTNAVTISQNLRNPIGNNPANITNCRCNDLHRPLPPKPPSVGICAVPISVPDPDEGQTSTLAAVVTARLAQHRLLTGQQPNSGQCLRSVNLPASFCDCSSCGSRNNVNSVTIPSSGDFLVTSISSEPPPNIVVETDVDLLGNLNVCGNLPFVSAVQFDGSYDTIGSGSVSFGGGSDPVTQELGNNAVSSTADSCRSPDVPRAPPCTLDTAAIGAGVTRARIPDADERQFSPTISSAAALFARLAQQKSSTTQQCPQPVSLPTPNCGCSSVVPCSFASTSTLPITQKFRNPINNNPAFNTALTNSCRCPELHKVQTTVAATADIAGTSLTRVIDADEQQTSGASMAAAVSARLAQQRLLTGQSNIEQCPRCISPSLPNCSCSSSGSSNSVITPGSSSLCVTSISSESPGVAVDTDVALSGNLDVCGTLPFASAVQFQGLYDTSGSGSVSFGCDSKPEQTLKNLNGNNSASTTTVNSCRSSQLPKYIPRALPTLTTVASEVGNLQPKTVDADKRKTSGTNMAAVVSARLAQHRLLTGQAPDCDCRSSVSPNFFTPSNGGVPVTSISPEPPGIDVDANIGLFGNLNVSGDLPFQSAVQFQGLYETSGSGTVSFGCGDCVAITQKLEKPSDKNTAKSTCQ